MKKFLAGLIIGGLIVGVFNFVKNNPNNEYVIKTKVWLHIINTGDIVSTGNIVDTGVQNIGMANPASTYCIQNGGTLEIKEGTGGQYGMCYFTNGSSCEERAYMRGECAPKKDTVEPITTTTKPDVNPEIPTACTMEYAPVCAKVQVECIKAPCPPIEQTFGNKCMMNANKKATFFHEGKCTADKIQCPVYTSPAPGFCSGGVIVPGAIDENGCQGHPTCKQ